MKRKKGAKKAVEGAGVCMEGVSRAYLARWAAMGMGLDGSASDMRAAELMARARAAEWAEVSAHMAHAEGYRAD